MKNAWILYDPDTNEVVGRGDGHLDHSCIGNAVVRYRVDHDAINVDATVQAKNVERESAAAIGIVNSTIRDQARVAKTITARLFLSEVLPPIDVDQSAPGAVLLNPDTPEIQTYVDPTDPDAIPIRYEELYLEWWNLFDLETTATNAWHLAYLIDSNARAETTIKEADRRREKVFAQNTLKQPRLLIPDD